MNLQEHGAARHPDAAAPFVADLERLTRSLPQDRAGLRLHGIPGLTRLLAAHALGALAPGRRAVRAILFDKSDAANWALGWHQDRTIAVRERREVAGFGPWSVKQGLQHVEPPFAVIEAMLTMRVHLDDVPSDNAPLLIARDSHRLWRIRESEIDAAVKRCGTAQCLAAAGDIWVYATPILHASAVAASGRRCRVLQVDFSADALPAGLEWLGI